MSSDEQYHDLEKLTIEVIRSPRHGAVTILPSTSRKDDVVIKSLITVADKTKSYMLVHLLSYLIPHKVTGNTLLFT